MIESKLPEITSERYSSNFNRSTKQHIKEEEEEEESSENEEWEEDDDDDEEERELEEVESLLLSLSLPFGHPSKVL